jgi:pimeloyl-ACP methyl ester carboxylesterase
VARVLAGEFPGHRLSAAGHSFGTDTALLFALQERLENLILFSPHPPGYLIEGEQYRELLVDNVWVVTGSKDFTHDGVGPRDRLQVAEFLDPSKLRKALTLEGVRHMDFAFEGLGPEGWQSALPQFLVE